MCGIAGKLFLDGSARVYPEEIQRMLVPIAHRGPDGHGVHLDGPCGLGHCRLSIIDLSNAGSQPMSNEDGTVWIVFNGEIYNFQELRTRLLKKGHQFRSQSDTEVIIHLYEELGPECVNELRGMFAFAIWDANRHRLFIARDRVGIKPLYYCQTAHSLWFASELKAIITDPLVPRDLNLVAVRRFLAFHYLPGKETLFSSICKLLPGHTLTVERGHVTIRRYWDLQFTQDRHSHSFPDVVEELHDLLRSTVRDHMIADVPVGVLLSGGVDSSAVLSFAVNGTSKRVKTFTVGFDDPEVVDERPYARLAAQRFGTEHQDISITAEDFWNFLPSYVRHMEEPVCEPPAVALYYVSRLARRHVKVVLSGEGGDEAFAGYPNYPNMLALNRLESLLGPLARSVGAVTEHAGRAFVNSRLQRYGHALGRPLAQHYFSRTSGPTTLFNQAGESLFSPGFLRAINGYSPAEEVADCLAPVRHQPLLDQMLYLDSKAWLPDDLLIKADKMTMANSLELRVPLLDHKVLEFAASLPPAYKVKGRQTKRALKAAFARVLPAEIIQRKKVGFPVPYNGWLRQELRSMLTDVLLSERACGRGFFKRQKLEQVVCDNTRTGHYSKELFCLLTLEMWERKFLDAPRTHEAARYETANCIPG